jgi:uroporphyrinogen-III synthase
MPYSSLKVWITRAEPGAWATAGRVRALGHEPLVAPLLVVEPAGPAQIDLAGVGALAFTSANGVRAFAVRSAARALPVFAVGAATARAAQAAGFAEVVHFDGDVNDLGAGLVRHAAGIEGVVLQPGAAEPAGDLAGTVGGQGLIVRPLALYATVPAAFGPPQSDALVRADAALVHSPKCAAILAELLTGGPRPDLKVYAISPAALAPLAAVPLAVRAAASRPRESDLLELLGQAAAP